MDREQTIWGNAIRSGAGSLNLVIHDIPAGRLFTEHEIADEVRRRGLTERGAVREHLMSLTRKGYVAKAEGGWVGVAG
ncbi:MAG: hypothetical protein K2X87_11600 [Gemmataceae bacterium]|nr:hypothetical protein [Gemmataceae bacterium]